MVNSRWAGSRASTDSMSLFLLSKVTVSVWNRSSRSGASCFSRSVRVYTKPFCSKSEREMPAGSSWGPRSYTLRIWAPSSLRVTEVG